jgi:hypothetical protein
MSGAWGVGKTSMVKLTSASFSPPAKKIPVHHQIADLVMKTANLGFVILALAAPPVENTSPSSLIAWRFHVLTWFGCTLCFGAIS